MSLNDRDYMRYDYYDEHGNGYYGTEPYKKQKKQKKQFSFFRVLLLVIVLVIPMALAMGYYLTTQMKIIEQQSRYTFSQDQNINNSNTTSELIDFNSIDYVERTKELAKDTDLNEYIQHINPNAKPITPIGESQYEDIRDYEISRSMIIFLIDELAKELSQEELTEIEQRIDNSIRIMNKYKSDRAEELFNADIMYAEKCLTIVKLLKADISAEPQAKELYNSLYHEAQELDKKRKEVLLNTLDNNSIEYEETESTLYIYW